MVSRSSRMLVLGLTLILNNGMRSLVALKPFQAWRTYLGAKCPFGISSPWAILASARRSQARSVSTVRSVDNSIDEATFYEKAYVAQEPLVIRDYTEPSVGAWFHRHEHGVVTLDSKLTSDPNTPEMPYEYVRTSQEDDLALANFTRWLQGDNTPGSVPSNIGSENQVRFDQFAAPLDLLSKAIEFNTQQKHSNMRHKRLYIAQMPINELPPGLRLDLEAPKLLQCSATPCDVYNTSIWLGLEPTYTPWHRDPNPNFFMQIVGQKNLRLLPPGPGMNVFMDVQKAIGTANDSRIRGAEMMQGPERSALHDAVWGTDAPRETLEATLGPSDCLFIPKGWWHSVKSVREDGHLNASVNWWFRFRQPKSGSISK